LPPADDVDVEVRHRLSGMHPRVDHQPVALLSEPLLPGQLHRHPEQLPSQRPLSLVEKLPDIREVLPGHHQKVLRGLGIDVGEGDHVLILVHQLDRYLTPGDLAEDTILFHPAIWRHRPPQVNPPRETPRLRATTITCPPKGVCYPYR